MSTASAYLTVRGIDIDVVYKDIKNLHLAVYPPLGRVRIAAPRRLEEEHLRLAVIQRLPWIKLQRQRLQDAARQSEREVVSGESHYVWGLRRRLKVVEVPGRARFELERQRLALYVPAGTDSSTRQKLLRDWQRLQLRSAIPPLIERWQPIVGRQVARWSIRRMKTKWGSCSPETGHVWLNLELVKKPPRCLEYIVVHEMTHLLESGHDDRFVELMDRFLPDWRSRRDELNSAPLAEESWSGSAAVAFG
jgi:predicted metal-dependent hydrolase